MNEATGAGDGPTNVERGDRWSTGSAAFSASLTVKAAKGAEMRTEPVLLEEVVTVVK